MSYILNFLFYLYTPIGNYCTAGQMKSDLERDATVINEHGKEDVELSMFVNN